eukprot:2120970-Alexandrium_andersonii.AAC.1
MHAFAYCGMCRLPDHCHNARLRLARVALCWRAQHGQRGGAGKHARGARPSHAYNARRIVLPLDEHGQQQERALFGGGLLREGRRPSHVLGTVRQSSERDRRAQQ